MNEFERERRVLADNGVRTEERPRRVQQRRTAGWRKPENTVSVARPSKWGNPFRVGHAQVRMPSVDGSLDWEHEGRLHKRSGEQHVYMRHIDGKDVFTWHQVEDATPEQCVEMFREYITGLSGHRLSDYGRVDRTQIVIAELRGKNLMCFCPLDQPCHADVLLEIANA